MRRCAAGRLRRQPGRSARGGAAYVRPSPSCEPQSSNLTSRHQSKPVGGRVRQPCRFSYSAAASNRSVAYSGNAGQSDART